MPENETLTHKADSVVEAVRADLLRRPAAPTCCADLLRRSQFGITKYGTTLDRTDLSLRDWLNHAYEECIDQANYLKRSIMEIDNAKD